MQITDYGEWTVVEHSNGSVEYKVSLHEVTFCKSFTKFYKGKRVAMVDMETGLKIGCTQEVGRLRPRQDLHANAKPLNTSEFLIEQLNIAQRQVEREREIK